MNHLNGKEKLTKDEQYLLGLLISYMDASLILNCSLQHVGRLVRKGRLKRVVYKKRQYIDLLSILVYSGDIDTGDRVVFMQKVNFKPLNNQQLNKSKEIRMEGKEWHEFWNHIDEQIKNL